MRFSSERLYDGQVESAPQVSHRGVLDYDHPIEWIVPENLSTDDREVEPCREQFVGDTFGRINRGEAHYTLDRVQYLRSQLEQRGFFKPYRHLITVNTVDGFQGQERDVVLISLVRSNEEGQIGFLRDLRRMNVAITRARMKLIIIGDRETMTRHPFYRRLWEYVEDIRQSSEAPSEARHGE